MTNTQPHAPGSGAGPAPAQQQPSQGQGFFDQLRGLGLRRSSDRWIAGVCGGVARRLGVDPVIVRAATIALFIIGVGVLAYLIAWVLLPDEDGTILAERAIRDGDSWGVTLLVIIGLAVFLTGIGDFGSSFSRFVLVVAIAAGAWWLVSRSRSDSSPSSGPGATSRPTSAAPMSTMGGPTAPAPTSGPQPVWSPTTDPAVGYEPPRAQQSEYAGSGSTQTSTQEKRRSAGLSGFLLVVGAALTGAGFAMAFSAQLGGSAIVAGLLGATAAAGLATVVLGILGRRSALSALLCLVLAISLVSTWGAGKTSIFGIDNGTQAWAPTASTVEQSYHWNAGSGVLDLRGVTETPKHKQISATVNFGELEILVPEGIPVRVIAQTHFGSVELTGTGSSSAKESGGGLSVRGDYLFGTTDPEAVDLTVRATVNFGEIQIRTPVDPAP